MDFFTRETHWLLSTTEIENIFLEEYLIDATSLQLKVYLFVQKYTQQQNKISIKKLAAKLHVSEDMVLDALDYWEKLDVVVINRDDNEISNINALSLRLKYMESTYSIKVREKSETKILDKKEILQKMLVKTLGRNVFPNEIKKINDTITRKNIDYDLLHICLDVIKENSKKPTTNLINNFLLTVANNGIKTDLEAKGAFKKQFERYNIHNSIFEYLGLYREPTQGEKNQIDTWLDNGYSIDDIKKSVDKTSGSSKISFNYIEKILYSDKKDDIDERLYFSKDDTRKKEYKNILNYMSIFRLPTVPEMEMLDELLDNENFTVQNIINNIEEVLSSKSKASVQVLYNSLLNKKNNKVKLSSLIIEEDSFSEIESYYDN